MSLVDVEIIRVSGSRENQRMNRAGLTNEIHRAIGAVVCDTVNLRDGRVMLVDDLGYQKELPLNPKATLLYHSVCRPGTTHYIRGDVAVTLDHHFAYED